MSGVGVVQREVRGFVSEWEALDEPAELEEPTDSEGDVASEAHLASAVRQARMTAAESADPDGAEPPQHGWLPGEPLS